MKNLCLILLLFFSLGSSLLSEQMYTCGMDSELLEVCETADTEEFDFNSFVPLDGYFHTSFRLANACLLCTNAFDNPTLFANTFLSDYLTPPPDFLFFS